MANEGQGGGEQGDTSASYANQGLQTPVQWLKQRFQDAERQLSAEVMAGRMTPAQRIQQLTIMRDSLIRENPTLAAPGGIPAIADIPAPAQGASTTAANQAANNAKAGAFQAPPIAPAVKDPNAGPGLGPTPVADGSDPYAAFKTAYRQAIGSDISQEQLNDNGYLSTLSNQLFATLPKERLVNTDGNTSFSLDRIAQLSNEDLLKYPELVRLMPDSRLTGPNGFSAAQLKPIITDPARIKALKLDVAATPAATPPATPPTSSSGDPTKPSTPTVPIRSIGEIGNLGNLNSAEALGFLGNLPEGRGSLDDPSVNAFLNLTGTNTRNGNPWLDTEASTVPDAAYSAMLALNAQNGISKADPKAIAQGGAATLGQGNLSSFDTTGGQAFLNDMAGYQNEFAKGTAAGGEGRDTLANLFNDPTQAWRGVQSALLSGLSPTLAGARNGVYNTLHNQWLQLGNQDPTKNPDGTMSDPKNSQSFLNFLKTKNYF